MKWKRTSKHSALSECGAYLVAGYRIDKKIVYRASRGGVFVTGALDSMKEINKAVALIAKT